VSTITGDLSTVVGLDGLQTLLDACGAGRTVYGPVERDGAIVTRPLSSIDQLPVGLGTDHGPGRARLTPSADRSRFGWAVGPQAWKPLLHPAEITTIELDRLDRAGPADPTTTPVTVRRTTATELQPPTEPSTVLFGVRPCDLAAIGTLDRVLLDTPPAPEPVYASRRNVLVVAVDCGTPAATCFCTSTGTGPDAGDHGYDVRLTELVDDNGAAPRYVVRAGTEAGRCLLAQVSEHAPDARTPTDRDHELVDAVRERAEAAMTRSIDTTALRAALIDELEHPDPGGLEAWADVADRCLACGNCTAVCPTCFCTSIDDVGDLTGGHVERRRRWTSCFELEYSRVGDAPIRSSRASRYRQWYIHKFATWVDQFGTTGCVGCGRCISWCPVGIDVTAEAGHRAASAPSPAEGDAP